MSILLLLLPAIGVGALVALQAPELNEEIVAETLGCFLKDESDVAAFKAELPEIISG